MKEDTLKLACRRAEGAKSAFVTALLFFIGCLLLEVNIPTIMIPLGFVTILNLLVFAQRFERLNNLETKLNNTSRHF